MRYYCVFDKSGSMEAEVQRARVRLALTTGMGELVLYESPDDDPNSSRDEEKFATWLGGTVEKPRAEECIVIAIGDGCAQVLDALSILAKRFSAPLSERSYQPFIQLVLIAPEIPSNVFNEAGDCLARGSLASRVCRRIVVLYSDGVSPSEAQGGRTGTLGCWGTAAKPYANVVALDVSALLLTHLKGICVYLQSLEVLGLICRAVGGASEAALRRFARRGVEESSR